MEAISLLSHCELCPRMCGVNRLKGQKGYCLAGATVRLGRAAPHHWEEPCLSGSRGSGTIFFSYCSLGCVYCQNHALSQTHHGADVSIDRLAEIYLELQAIGVHNINLVTPTHYVPQIIAALQEAKAKGFSLPVVYNSSGYEKVEIIELLDGFIDVYLPDLKYYSPQFAKRYSNAPDYFEVARRAIAEMVRQVGPPQIDDEGMLVSGVLIRHMMLPGLLFDSKKIIEHIHHSFHNQVYFSLMNQYTPCGKLTGYDEINRPLPPEHYEAMIAHALSLGMENGFIQDGQTNLESFIPFFNGEGVVIPNCP